MKIGVEKNTFVILQ